MQTRNVAVKVSSALAVLAVMGLMALPASAAVILYDDFLGTAGSSPDPGKWTATSGIALDGSVAGNAVFTVPPTQTLDALPGYGFVPGGGLIGRLTYQLTDIDGNPATGPNEVMGLTDGSAVIQLRTDQGGGVWQLLLFDGGPNYGLFNTGVARSDHTGKWEIDWGLTQVQVFDNGVLLFDSAVNLPTSGNDLTQWHIPQVALRPNFLMYGSSDSDAVDWVNWESVSIPEPSSVALLLFGGVLVRRRCRKN